MNWTKTLILAGLSVTLAVIFPALLFALVAMNFIVHFAVMGLQLLVTRFKIEDHQLNPRLVGEPFVSIHVPTHNEPPEVVRQTLMSLSGLQWSNYEVLVIDNNTDDPALWKPIETLCVELGSRFRFFHVENLSGFKAGAMNYVRQYMNRRAQFIFVVDADYTVQPDALRVALSHFTDPAIGLIQFPQDYRNVTKANRGIALDYKHYFSGFMNVGNLLGCVPSTGTMALVNVHALEQIGGFDTDVITEDADLGLRLCLQGYRSLYVNQVVGSGLMPHELDGLKKQRWRWAFGNAQILRRNWKTLLFSPALTLKQRMGFIANFSAWFSFSLVPSLSLILLAFYSLAGELGVSQIYTVVLAGFSLSTYAVLKYGILHYSLQRDGHGLSDIWKAFTSHIGLGWVFNASWIRCIFVCNAPFIRTNKFILGVVPGTLKNTVVEFSLGMALLCSSLIFAITDFVVGPLAAAAMCAGCFAIYWVGHQTKHTLIATVALFPEPNNQPENLTMPIAVPIFSDGTTIS